MTKPTKDEIEANPERYRLLANGAVYDYEVGHIVAHTGEGPYQITAANARAMAERRRQKGIQSRLRGMIRGAGMDIDESATDDEILNKASDALEAYVAHMGQMFLKSENLRGMGETFTKLVTPFADEGNDDESSFAQVRGIIRDLAELGRQINNSQERQVTNGNVIDAE